MSLQQLMSRQDPNLVQPDPLGFTGEYVQQGSRRSIPPVRGEDPKFPVFASEAGRIAATTTRPRRASARAKKAARKFARDNGITLGFVSTVERKKLLDEFMVRRKEIAERKKKAKRDFLQKVKKSERQAKVKRLKALERLKKEYKVKRIPTETPGETKFGLDSYDEMPGPHTGTRNMRLYTTSANSMYQFYRAGLSFIDHLSSLGVVVTHITVPLDDVTGDGHPVIRSLPISAFDDFGNFIKAIEHLEDPYDGSGTLYDGYAVNFTQLDFLGMRPSSPLLYIREAHGKRMKYAVYNTVDVLEHGENNCGFDCLEYIATQVGQHFFVGETWRARLREYEKQKLWLLEEMKKFCFANNLNLIYNNIQRVVDPDMSLEEIGAQYTVPRFAVKKDGTKSNMMVKSIKRCDFEPTPIQHDFNEEKPWSIVYCVEGVHYGVVSSSLPTKELFLARTGQIWGAQPDGSIANLNIAVAIFTGKPGTKKLTAAGQTIKLEKFPRKKIVMDYETDVHRKELHQIKGYGLGVLVEESPGKLRELEKNGNVACERMLKLVKGTAAEKLCKERNWVKMNDVMIDLLVDKKFTPTQVQEFLRAWSFLCSCNVAVKSYLDTHYTWYVSDEKGTASEKFYEWLRHQRGVTYDIWSFNGANFDSYCMYHDFMQLGHNFTHVPIMAKSQMLSFRVFNHQVKDIKKFLGAGGLSETCKQFGIKFLAKKPGGYSMVEIQKKFDAGDLSYRTDPATREYNSFDCLSLALIVFGVEDALREVFPTRDISNYLTLGMMVHKEITHWITENKIVIDKTVDEAYYSELKMWRVGGRVDLFNGPQQIKGRMASLDACSLYPYAMFVMPNWYPCGECHVSFDFSDCEIPATKKVLHERFRDDSQTPCRIGYYNCKVNQDAMECKYLPQKNFTPSSKSEGNDFKPKGWIQCCISSEAIKFIRKQGGLVKVVNGHYYDQVIKGCELFEPLIKCMKLKNDEDEKKRNELPYNMVLREMYKAIMNIESGKMNQDLNTDGRMLVSVSDYLNLLDPTFGGFDEDTGDTKKNALNRKKNQLIGRELTTLDEHNGMIHITWQKTWDECYKSQHPLFIGALIYDYARMHMYEHVYSKMPFAALVYSDTDSLKCRYQDFEKWVNPYAFTTKVPHWREIEDVDPRYKWHGLFEWTSKVFGSFADELAEEPHTEMSWFAAKKLYLCGLKMKCKGIGPRNVWIGAAEYLEIEGHKDQDKMLNLYMSEKATRVGGNEQAFFAKLFRDEMIYVLCSSISKNYSTAGFAKLTSKHCAKLICIEGRLKLVRSQEDVLLTALTFDNQVELEYEEYMDDIAEELCDCDDDDECD